LRHAEILTALHNGAMRRRDNKAFTPADFMRADPWAPPAPPPDLSASLFSAIDAHDWGA
jgi:hypothetical protein